MPDVDFADSNVAFALSCAFDTVVVLAALATRRALALVAAFAVLALKGLAMLDAGLDPTFGVQHVVWLDLVIVAPLGGLLLLLQRRWRPVAILALLAAPVGAYASFVEPSRLVTERAALRLEGDRAGAKPVRLGVITDLQFERVSDHERDAVERLVREEPDVILVPGDVHQGPAESLARELPAIRRLLRGLRAPGGVFAVEGDSEDLAELRLVTRGTGVRVLHDETARVRVRDRLLRIAGVRRSFDAATIRAIEDRPGERDVRILLAHRPDAVLHLSQDTRVDLVVAGHTHGGQLQLPLLGPPFIASDVPRDVGAGGLHDLGGRRIYVSRGVGVERGQAPRLRLGAVPEVSIVTLR